MAVNFLVSPHGRTYRLGMCACRRRVSSWTPPCSVWCRRCKALGRTWPAPSKRERPGAANPVSSGGAARWSSRRPTISLVLPVGPGVFLRSFQRVQSVDPGFGREPTVLMTLTDAGNPVHARRGARPPAAPPGSLPGAPRRRGGRRHQQPGPEPAQPELERLQRRRVRAADRPRCLHRGPGRGRAGVLRGGRHRDRRGRNFNDADRPDTRPVVIVSETMPQRFWTDGDAVGRRRDDDPPGSSSAWRATRG